MLTWEEAEKRYPECSPKWDIYWSDSDPPVVCLLDYTAHGITTKINRSLWAFSSYKLGYLVFGYSYIDREWELIENWQKHSDRPLYGDIEALPLGFKADRHQGATCATCNKMLPAKDGVIDTHSNTPMRWLCGGSRKPSIELLAMDELYK